MKPRADGTLSQRLRRPTKRRFDSTNAKAAIQSYQGNPLEEVSFIDHRTKTRRQQIWANWLEFAKAASINPEEVWLDLCSGKQGIQSIFQTFLRMYVEDSVTERPCLGLEEYKLVRTLNSAVSVEDIWSLLVNEADDIVMRPKRRDRRTADFWNLRFSSQNTTSGCGPAYEIARWIPLLADELGLLKKQSFEKTAMTGSDVITLLKTLWKYAKHIPCNPGTRLASTTAIVLGGLGGWRPGSLVDILYRDISIAWVRDASVPERTWTVAFVTIHHVKQRQHRIQRDQRASLRFVIPEIPSKLLCILTQLVVKAIADNAFQAAYTCCEDVLKPPVLAQGCNYVPLSWKKDFLDTPIVPVSYEKLRKLWTRMNVVAGARDMKRLYALRVGALAQLDGCLKPALRNFITSQSTEVFEKSYMPVQLPLNLPQIAYQVSIEDDEALWSALRAALLKRDAHAPIYITKDELEEFESRRDLTDLHRQLVEAKECHGPSSKQAKTIMAKKKYIIDCLERLKLEEKRREYFARVDERRAAQQSTTDIQQDWGENPRLKMFAVNEATAAKICRVADDHPPQTLANDLVAYLLGTIVHESSNDADAERPRCLFGCGSFANRDSLTRHVLQKHMDEFKSAFACPECRRAGKGEQCVPAGAEAWSSHIERSHGKLHTPKLDSPEAMCLLCAKVRPKRGFAKHLETIHELDFAESFACPECQKIRPSEISLISGKEAWKHHVYDVHHGTAYGAVLKGGPVRFGKPKSCETKLFSNSHGYVKLKEGYYDSSGDWRPPTPDIHACEEFWVEGRD